MKILFLHGWHSVPGGVKPTYVKKHGHTVINPALDDDDFDAGSQDRRGCVRSPAGVDVELRKAEMSAGHCLRFFDGGNFVCMVSSRFDSI